MSTLTAASPSAFPATTAIPAGPGPVSATEPGSRRSPAAASWATSTRTANAAAVEPGAWATVTVSVTGVDALTRLTDAASVTVSSGSTSATAAERTSGEPSAANPKTNCECSAATAPATLGAWPRAGATATTLTSR